MLLVSGFLLRITPARAGRTHEYDFTYINNEDHPRSRGKDSQSPMILFLILGSPPLAREGRGLIAFKRDQAGITPARAGRTNGRGIAVDNLQDHPRSRGKDNWSNLSFSIYKGSPPLAREGQNNLKILHNVTGITPARAGRTKYLYHKLYPTEDHPRSRGKDKEGSRAKAAWRGSPPLAREGPF